MKAVPIAAVLLPCVVACAKTTPDPPATVARTSATAAAPAGSPAATAQPPTRDPKGGTVVPIRLLGISGRVPAGAPAPSVNGDASMLLVEGGKFTARVWATKESDPKTAADAQAFAKNFKPKSVQTETLADGWSITFETVGPSFIVIVGREVAGTAYHCEATEDSIEELHAAAAFCKSLAK